MTAKQTVTRTSLLQGVAELTDRDPVLAGIVERYGPPPLWSRPRGFPTLVRIILEQQVSLGSAAALFARLQAAVGPAVAPADVQRLGIPGLQALGFTRQKAGYVAGLAGMLVAGEISLARIARMHDAEAHQALVAVPGIGPWTSGVYLLMALRRPDVWPRGDLGLHKSIAETHGLAIVPTSDEAAILAQRWRPWRSVAARLLWHSYLSRRKAATRVAGRREKMVVRGGIEPPT
jgi:DNA-3-methyladenine glycosylase II